MKYKEAFRIAKQIRWELSEFCARCEIAGSIRREKPQVNDIEIVAIPKVNRCFELKDYLYHQGRYTILKGSFPGRYMRLQRNANDTFIDLFFCTESTWWMIFLIRTGNADFSKFMVTRAKRMGYRVEGGKLYDKKGIPVEIITEATIFNILLFPWLPPWKRNLNYRGYQDISKEDPVAWMLRYHGSKHESSKK